jgi:hypothetical protein
VIACASVDGNVYLFKPDMCPIGGVHINMNGAKQVAAQLGIDAAPAQTVRAQDVCD